MTKRFIILILLVFSLFLSGCATHLKEANLKEAKRDIVFLDISSGLPKEGQWRQNIALFDMNNDGYLDIIAPPPREAEKNQKKPFIFLWDKDKGSWVEGTYKFPSLNYDFGGIAVGDINGDGLPDIILAINNRGLMLLINKGNNEFSESPIPATDFLTRTVVLKDINKDGWLDIIAASQSVLQKGYIPKGILVGINKQGRDWDFRVIDGSEGLFADSIDTGDIDGDGNQDIIIAPLTNLPDKKKFIWFGDGKGNFFTQEIDIGENNIPFNVSVVDIDGDERDEVMLRLSTIGEGSTIFLSAFGLLNNNKKDIPIDLKETPIVFTTAKSDAPKKGYVIALTEKNIVLLRHENGKLIQSQKQPLEPVNAKGSYYIISGRNKDGSTFIVYNLGYLHPEFKNGIRAYLLKGEF